MASLGIERLGEPVTMVEGDEQRLIELEQLFRSLDDDADGRLRLGELEAALRALQPVEQVKAVDGRRPSPTDSPCNAPDGPRGAVPGSIGQRYTMQGLAAGHLAESVWPGDHLSALDRFE